MNEKNLKFLLVFVVAFEKVIELINLFINFFFVYFVHSISTLKIDCNLSWMKKVLYERIFLHFSFVNDEISASFLFHFSLFFVNRNFSLLKIKNNYGFKFQSAFFSCIVFEFLPVFMLVFFPLLSYQLWINIYENLLCKH